MNVIALRHAPVFPYPGSSVMSPVLLRSAWMSTAVSPSEPVWTGSERVLPSYSSVALVVGGWAVVGVMQGLLKSQSRVRFSGRHATALACGGLNCWPPDGPRAGRFRSAARMARHPRGSIRVSLRALGAEPPSAVSRHGTCPPRRGPERSHGREPSDAEDAIMNVRLHVRPLAGRTTPAAPASEAAS